MDKPNKNYVHRKHKEKKKLSVQLNETKKLKPFVLPEPISLEVSLLKKTQLPGKG
jgi:hypothetical protein